MEMTDLSGTHMAKKPWKYLVMCFITVFAFLKRSNLTWRLGVLT